MMKAEMDDAFRLRKSIMLFMIAAGVGSVVFAGAIGRWLVRVVLLWKTEVSAVNVGGSGAQT